MAEKKAEKFHFGKKLLCSSIPNVVFAVTQFVERLSLARSPSNLCTFLTAKSDAFAPFPPSHQFIDSFCRFLCCFHHRALRFDLFTFFLAKFRCVFARRCCLFDCFVSFAPLWRVSFPGFTHLLSSFCEQRLYHSTGRGKWVESIISLQTNSRRTTRKVQTGEPPKVDKLTEINNRRTRTQHEPLTGQSFFCTNKRWTNSENQMRACCIEKKHKNAIKNGTFSRGS